jgi:hypothetical protein
MIRSHRSAVPAWENAGKLVVTITAATFFNCNFWDLFLRQVDTPNWDSILLIAWVVNGVWVV